MLTQKIKVILARIALATLHGLARLRRLLNRMWKPLQPIAVAIGRFSMRFALLPAYRLLIFIRLRVGKIVLSARGLVFIIFTNRYVFHVMVAGIGFMTIASQFETKSATALDAGQRSLLYAIVSDGHESLVEEDARPELASKDARYLGPETIESLPSIDFDYYENQDQQISDLTGPGSSALLPGSELPGEPGDVRIERTKTETYAVKDGDTISTIARSFGVNVGTVLWANNLTARTTIRPGTTLKIPPVSGVLHTIKKGDTLKKIADTYGANVDEILAFNHLSADSKLAVNEELIVPGGTPPAPAPIAIRKPSNANVRPDVPIARIAGKALDVYQELTGKNDGRAKPQDLEVAEPSANAKISFLWPTHLHVINQYYGWQHTGVDIDGDYVDPIYAAADGVVEKAGWNSGGYGLMILLDHGNGNKTRYGHASKLFVKEGDTVKRGQVMAMVGTTGRSTGTHLHYEVYINNKRVNPLAYTAR